MPAPCMPADPLCVDGIVKADKENNCVIITTHQKGMSKQLKHAKT